MRIQIIGFRIFLLFLPCFFISSITFAENNFASLSFRQQITKDIFQIYEVKKAIIKLCRELGIDPRNKTAQQNFQLIAGHPALGAKQRAQIYLLQDLLGFNRDLKRRSKYLVIKRDVLKDQLIESGNNDVIFEQNLRDIKSNMERPIGVQSYYYHPLFGRSDPLIQFYQILNDEKDRLLARVEYLHEQYRWLKITKNDGQGPVPPDTIVQYSNIVIPSISDSFINVEPQLMKGEVDELINVFPDRITLAPIERKDFDSHEKPDNFKQKDQKIDDLSMQVVDLSLRMSEIETLFKREVKSAELLKAELDDVQQRFMLGRRIIQEKDSEIQSLQETLDYLKKESKNSDNVSYSRDEKLIELSGMLEIYKHKLGEKDRLAKEKTRALYRTQNNFNALQGQLATLESELLEIKRHSINGEFQNPEIENKIQELHSQFKDIQYFFLENLYDSDKIKSYPRFKSSNLVD